MARGGEQGDPAASEARVPEAATPRGGAAAPGGEPGGQAGGCIILADSEASVPVELLAGLSRRGMAVAVVTDTPAAMVRLAREGAAALLVAAGTQLPGHHDLLQAVRRYHPRTGCWEYVRAEKGIRLNRLGVQPPAAPREMPARAGDNGRAAAPPAPNGTPANGHAKRRSLDDIVLHLPGATLGPNEPLVTEEELAMLLGSGVGHGDD